MVGNMLSLLVLFLFIMMMGNFGKGKVSFLQYIDKSSIVLDIFPEKKKINK